jgi:5-methylcytosine-specific restriction protein A
MPSKIRRECSQPACRKLTTTRFCEKHLVENHAKESSRQHDRGRRDDPFRAIYKTARWQRVRIQIIYRDPLCCICKMAASEMVDHIIPARDYAGDFFDEENLQGLCKACHDIKTATEDGGFGRDKT